ncbi:hypothetical protein FQN51_004304 [Onygenales sp. PD_10]|nr:hypothetical protein FQN51_004304 [Onygenales sp. PD_10]
MGSSPAKRFEITEFGLSEVYCCPEPRVPQVDIVFVHGLNGSPHNTWATKKPEVFWPADLLPQTLHGLNVRILTYGYDANVASFEKGTSKERLHNHAEHLAAQLMAKRSLDRALERPIIFVCHSLGGIVVKRTLLHCEHQRHPNTQHLRSTYVSTYAILFMGTPHNGSELANLGSMIQMIASLVPKKFFDTTPNMLKTLKPDNETLQNVNRQFSDIMGRFRIYYFHESKPMDLKGTKRFVVEESSAAPLTAGVERMGIEADHGAMVRFESPKSPGYEAVAEAILRYATDAPREIALRWAQEQRLRANIRKEDAELLLLNNNMEDPRAWSLSSLPTDRIDSLDNSIASLPPGQNSELLPLSKSQLMSSTELPPPNEQGESLLIAPLGFHPNWVFLGMEKELEELHTRLFKVKRRINDVVSVLIYGGSGSGKTHLARQYVFKHRDAYTGGVFWIDARSKEACCQCFWDIAEKVSSTIEKASPDPDWLNRDRYIEKVLKWLGGRENWLVVFDGLSFDTDDEINDFRRFIPYHTNSSIIYTSVDRTLTKKRRLYEPFGLKVRPLSVNDARKLLFKDIGIKHPTAEQIRKATELVEHYECLPLAIHAMGHRLRATGKPIERYRVNKPQATDKRLAEPYHGIMGDLQKNNHPEALHLITILSFFEHHVPVGMVHLGRKALANHEVEIRSLDPDGNPGRHIDNTFAILIRYGLIERAFDPYLATEQNSPVRRSTDLSEKELESSQTSSSQNTSTTLPNNAIDIVKIHSVVQGFFRDELLRLGPAAFAWWLVVSTHLFFLSYNNATSRIKTEKTPGLIKDFQAYETHASILLKHFKEIKQPKSVPDLHPDFNTMHRALSQARHAIVQEITNRSPGSSQELLKQQKSIFDRSSSTSSVPDTPTSSSSRFTWEMEAEYSTTHSPVELSPSRQRNPTFPSTASQYLPLPPAEDHGYESDLEGSQTALPMSPTLSQTTEVPIQATASQEEGEGEWNVVPPKIKTQKSKGSGIFERISRPFGIRRRPGHRNLGSYRPVNPVVSVTSVHGEGASSRVQESLVEGTASAKSDAEASLAAVHHSSPPPSRGTIIKHMNQRAAQKENHTTYANVLAGRRLSDTPSSSRSSPSLGRGSDTSRQPEEAIRARPGNVPSPHGWSPRVSSDNLVHSVHSESGLGSNWRYSDPVDRGPTPPSRFGSRHASRSSEGSSGNIPGLRDAYSQSHFAGHARVPLPYQSDITITTQEYPSFVVPGQSAHGLGLAPRQTGGIYGMPTIPQMPAGYSSQPMSRNVSMQSEQSLQTEPSRMPPKISPGPAKRRSSPLSNVAQTATPRLDTRSPAFMFGQSGSAIGSSPSTPGSYEAMAMSRGSSAPGMMIDSGDGMGPSFVEFSNHPVPQHIQFGGHDPISVEEARQRTAAHYENQFHTEQHGESPYLNNPAHLPYPSRNLMPSASNDDQLQSMARTQLDGLGSLREARRFRSGSSPARPDMDTYNRYR